MMAVQFRNWPCPLAASSLPAAGRAEAMHIQLATPEPHCAVLRFTEVKVAGRTTEQLEGEGARQPPRRKSVVRDETS